MHEAAAVFGLWYNRAASERSGKEPERYRPKTNRMVKETVGFQLSDFCRSPGEIQRFGSEQLDTCTYRPNGLKTKIQRLSQSSVLSPSIGRCTTSDTILFFELPIANGHK